jgi:hypothetical protein
LNLGTLLTHPVSHTIPHGPEDPKILIETLIDDMMFISSHAKNIPVFFIGLQTVCWECPAYTKVLQKSEAHHQISSTLANKVWLTP